MNDIIESLAVSPAQIRTEGAHWTAREITQQPTIWPQIARALSEDRQLADFLAPVLGTPGLRVVLTGAGTSSFIGTCLQPALSRAGRRAEAISTTDIVASPASTLAAKTPTLLVHFARSGNSPESVATLALTEQHIENCTHLIFTCNAHGELHQRRATVKHGYSVLLPEACNDQSFAMTSSFSGMLLAAALALGVMPPEQARHEAISRVGAAVLTAHTSLISALTRAQFERVIYLGSNELRGLACESALKLLELTDGRVVSLADSPLGFRHGPKTIVNGRTLVVIFLSSDPYTRRYDLDLVHELRRDGVAARVLALSGPQEGTDGPGATVIGASAEARSPAGSLLTDLELCLPFVMFAQILALQRSLSLGLSPDSPNASGTVSRVVQGVSIYPYPQPS
jgi:tagatose-6-phosphate ketose/aldose isomerase